jgi:hypothetical protein
MKRLLRSLFSWSHTPTGDTILGVLLFLACLALLCSLPLWV